MRDVWTAWPRTGRLPDLCVAPFPPSLKAPLTPSSSTVAGSAPSPTKSSRRSESPTPSGHSRSASGNEREFCDDCEVGSDTSSFSNPPADASLDPQEYGHSLENCTLSSEIF